MKRLFLPITLLAVSLATVSAQNLRIFAITGDSKGNLNWNAIREINGKDGSVKGTIYTPSSKQNIAYFSAANKNVVPTAEPAITMVAASAYDAKNNRLYFTNMRGNTLNYIDLSKKDLTVISNDEAVFNTGDKFKSEANIITRMTFGADGAGYALTNDGEHLLRFTTNKKATVTDLGRLTDGSNNGNTSVHNQCSSWGGDMVGDAFGNLYLITMHSSVYKINTQTLVADLIGSIKGLPAEFTNNGAAVDENGDLIVSGAAYTASYFKVDFPTLQVTEAIKNDGGVYNASDLASANLLYAGKVASKKPVYDDAITESVDIYPNPVVGRTFNVKINGSSTDKYVYLVTDARGKVISQASTLGNQTLKVNLPSSGTTSGLYFVKVINKTKQTVYNNRIVLTK